MSIGGILQRSNKKEPAGTFPPFPTNSAYNGLSVETGTGIIVLGQDVGAVGNPAILLSNREIPAANFTISFNASAAQTNNIVQFKNTGAAVRARITNIADFSNTGGNSGSEKFGDLASVGSNTNATAIGNSAIAASNDSIAIGTGANSGTGGINIAIGRSAIVTGAIQGNVLIGSSATSTGSNTTLIGAAASATARSTGVGYSISIAGVNSTGIGDSVVVGAHEYSIALGFGARTTAANQMVIGSPTAGTGGINDIYIGRGVTCVEANNIKMQPTGASGADMAGNSFTIAGGPGTGNATPGAVLIQVSKAGASGSTLQTLGTWGKFESNVVTLGDIDATGNSTKLTIADNTQTVKVSMSGSDFLYIDPIVGSQMFIGDFSSAPNAGYLYIDTGSGLTEINGSNGVTNAYLDINGATQKITTGGTDQMIGTQTAFANGAGAAAGTLTNAPAAGDPTKWIPIDDNGTTRYIPAW